MDARPAAAFLLAAGLVAAVTAPPATAATTFVVDTAADDPGKTACTPAPNDCSLRGAIATAAVTAGADEVDLSSLPDGTTISLTNGHLSVGGHEVTLSGHPADPSSITIDAGGTDRVLEVGADADLTVAGLTLANGRADATSSPTGTGGAIYAATNSILRLVDVHVRTSTAVGTDGYDDGGTSVPPVTARGGGLAVRGTATIVRTQFIDNTSVGGDGYSWSAGSPSADATYGGAAYGGGVYVDNQGTLAVTDSTFVGNEATGGAAGTWGFSGPTGSGPSGGSAFGSGLMAFGSVTGTGLGIVGGAATGRNGAPSSVTGTADNAIGGSGGAARGAIYLAGTVDLTGVVIEGHTATGGDGGAGIQYGPNGKGGGTSGSALGGIDLGSAEGSLTDVTVRDTTATSGASGISTADASFARSAIGAIDLGPSAPLTVSGLTTARVTATGGAGRDGSVAGDGSDGGAAMIVVITEEGILDGWRSIDDVAVGGDGGDGGHDGADGGRGGSATGLWLADPNMLPTRITLDGLTLGPGTGGHATGTGGFAGGDAGVGVGVDLYGDGLTPTRALSSIAVTDLVVDSAAGGNGGAHSTLAGGAGGAGSAAFGIRARVPSNGGLTLDRATVLGATLQGGAGGQPGDGSPDGAGAPGGDAVGLSIDGQSGAGPPVSALNLTVADVVAAPGAGSGSEPGGVAGGLATGPDYEEQVGLAAATLARLRTGPAAGAPGAPAVVLGDPQASLSVTHGLLGSADAPTCDLGGGGLIADHSIATDTSCGLTGATNTQGLSLADLGLDVRVDRLTTDGVPTVALAATAPAVDGGQASPCPLDTDARGLSRPQDGDGDGVADCDIGAYERPATTPDPGPGGVDRLAGTTRIETAVLASQAAFGSADTVVLARADTYPDALAGAPLAYLVGAPLLLTPTDSLHEAVADEIERLGASAAILLGGEAALSAQVAADLEARSVAVDRFAGATRFETAAQIAAAVRDPGGHGLAAAPSAARRASGATDGDVGAFVTEGSNPDPSRGWPDALGVGPWAAVTGTPILLTHATALPDDTADALAALGVTDVTIVGGLVAVSAEVEDAVGAIVGTVDRVSGPDRYATAAQVAEAALSDGLTPGQTWIATGAAFPDALGAGPAVAAVGGSLLLVHPDDLDGSPATRDWVADHAGTIETLRILGGVNAIAKAVEEALAALLT